MQTVERSDGRKLHNHFHPSNVWEPRCDLRACLGLRFLPSFLPETLHEQEPHTCQAPTPASLLVPPGRSTEPSGMTHKRTLESTSLALHRVDEAPRPRRGSPRSAGLAGTARPDSHSVLMVLSAIPASVCSVLGGEIFPGHESLLFFLPISSLSCSQPSFVCLCMSLCVSVSLS